MKIYYIVPIENDEKNVEAPFSPFQGFSPGLFNISDKIEKIIELPTDFDELFLDERNIIALRMIGLTGYNIIPMMKKELKHMAPFLTGIFYCIFSDENTYSDAKLLIEQFELPILHVTTIPQNKDEISYDNINREKMLSFYYKVIHFLKEKKYPTPDILNNSFQKLKEFKKKALLEPKRGHLLTEPNERVLSSFNYCYQNTKKLYGYSDEEYIKAITDSCDLVLNERNKIFKEYYGTTFVPAGVTLILTSAAMYRHLYRIKKRKKTFSDDDIDILNSTFRLLQKQKSYSIHTTTHDFKKLMASSAGKFLLEIRLKETIIFTLSNVIIGCNNFCPTIRLPPIVNSLHPDLEQLGIRDRGVEKKKNYKINKLYNRISKKIEKLIPDEYIKRINKNQNHIKIVSDIPLEWLAIRTLPLMLRYETSRIPVTPGNLLFASAVSGSTSQIPINDFEEILIIRSFKDEDPIRNTLKKAIDVVLEAEDLSRLKRTFERDKDTKELESHLRKDPIERRKISIRWADVDNKSDFIEVLNSYSGAMLVFDGHGHHDKSLDIGSILLKGNPLNLMEIRTQVRLPPIVLLSACDTHPIDRSHASSASSFLIAGAKTVLGTFLPIRNIDAAVFLARLILRLQEFLPLAAHNPKLPLTWSNFIIGMLRMTYTTEIMNMLIKERIINLSKDSFLKIGALTNNAINSGQSTWYESYLNLLSKESKKSIEEIKTAIKIWATFTDCLKYVQLGNPEKILLFKN